VARSVAPGDSLARAAEIMESLGTREVPVIDGRALVGILTRTDMEPYRGHFEWTPVQAAMTHDPVSVSPEAPIGEVMSLLLERGFNSVPVTAGGELLGMIARTDVLRALTSGY
jgi:CBS domain-containing protein